MFCAIGPGPKSEGLAHTQGIDLSPKLPGQANPQDTGLPHAISQTNGCHAAAPHAPGLGPARPAPCSARLGSARPSSARLGSARLG